MNWKVLMVCLVVLFAIGCTSSNCEVDADCAKEHFTGACVEGNCSYTPIPGDCGNLKCETNENSCTCQVDCGACAGQVSANLIKSCDAKDKCSTDVDVSKQRAESFTSLPILSGGDSFTIISSFNNPFNVRRDELTVLVYLSQKNPANKDHRLTNIEMSAQTQSGQRVVLASSSISKSILGTGRDLGASVALRLSGAGNDEEQLRNIEMVLSYEYTSTSGASQTLKVATMKNPFKNLQFTLVAPDASYKCPDSCDDQNEGTDDRCDESTDFFCVHDPRAMACGNGVCEQGESKCGCAKDCGVCASQTVYLQYSCQGISCVGSVKASVVPKEESLFDARPLGPFELTNTFSYRNPFNIDTDRIRLSSQLKSAGADITDIKITAVRVLDGTSIIGEMTTSQDLANVGATARIDVPITTLNVNEVDKVLNLRIEYSYKQAGAARNGQFSRSLNKAVLLNP